MQQGELFLERSQLRSARFLLCFRLFLCRFQFGKAKSSGFHLLFQRGFVQKERRQCSACAFPRRLPAHELLLGRGKLRTGCRQGSFLLGRFLLQCFPGSLCLLCLCGKRRSFGTEPLNFRTPAQKPCVAGVRTACERTARIDNLAVKRDDAEAIRKPLGDGDCAVQILRHDNAAEQGTQDLLIFRIAPAQCAGNSQKTGALFQSSFPQQGAMDGGNGQKGSAAGAAAFQQFDRQLGVALRAHNDMLHGSAECRLNGDGIPLRNFNQLGNGAVNAAQISPLRFAHHCFYALGKAFHVSLEILEQAGAPLALLRVEVKGITPCPRLLRFFAAALQTQLMAAHGIAERFRPGRCLFFPAFRFCLLFFPFRAPLRFFRPGGLCRLPAAAQFFRRGGRF